MACYGILQCVKVHYSMLSYIFEYHSSLQYILCILVHTWYTYGILSYILVYCGLLCFTWPRWPFLQVQAAEEGLWPKPQLGSGSLSRLPTASDSDPRNSDNKLGFGAGSCLGRKCNKSRQRLLAMIDIVERSFFLSSSVRGIRVSLA